jgi:hypothetical protein
MRRFSSDQYQETAPGCAKNPKSARMAASSAFPGRVKNEKIRISPQPHKPSAELPYQSTP